MAEYRTIHTRIWREDAWFQDLAPDAKLLFVYLFTNPSASVAGIYRLPIRTMANETGIDLERIETLIAEFTSAGKIEFDRALAVLWVRKMREYQTGGGERISPKVKTRMDKDIQSIPYCTVKHHYLIAYGYPTDTLSIGEPESARDTDTDTYPIGDAAPSDEKVNPSDPLAKAKEDLKSGSNKPAIVGHLFTLRFGNDYKPDYGRLGRMAGQLSGDYTTLAKLIWQSPQVTGDPHDYIQALVNKAKAKRASPRNGRQSEPDPQIAFYRKLEQAERERQAEPQPN